MRKKKTAGGEAPPAVRLYASCRFLELEPELEHHDAVVVVAQARFTTAGLRAGRGSEPELAGVSRDVLSEPSALYWLFTMTVFVVGLAKVTVLLRALMMTC